MAKLARMQAAEAPLKVEKTISISSPVKTKPHKTAKTGNAGAGYERKPKGELFLLAVSNMVGEKSFYEASEARDDRYRELIHKITLKDPDWIAQFVPYLRNVMNMRTAAVVMAAESALCRITHKMETTPTISTRQMVASALQRADEPGEFLAYWVSRTGKHTLPGGVQRGLADAVTRMYNEYSAIKYDGTGQPWRMGDVIELVHPTPWGGPQSDLFRYLLDRKHHPETIRVELDRLPVIKANLAIKEIPQDQRAKAMTPELFRQAGMTWETASSWLGGKLTKEFWEAMIPNMGYMALLRNLRNFEEAKISKKTVQAVCAKLSDKDEVLKSRQFPMRFLSAYKEVNNVQWAPALQDALDLSLNNVPILWGKTLIVCDMSGSMFWDTVSAKSKLSRAEGAAVFAAALALRAEDPTLIIYGNGSREIPVPEGGSLLPLVQKMTVDMGGTDTARAISSNFAGHDRVVLLTDEQSSGTPADRAVPVHVWLHTFNLAGYRVAGSSSGNGKRSTFGGLTDVGFKMIPLLEQGLDQSWPWEQTGSAEE